MKQGPLSGLLGIAVGAALFLCAFWLRFGRIDQYALGFAAFLVLLAAGFEYLPREALKAQGLDQRPTYRQHPLDVLGVVWLLAIPFAPALSWMLTNFFDVGVGNWRLLLGVRAALCVVLPVVCVLPLLRFIRRGTAGIACAILALGTGYPVATAAGSAYDVVEGPVWQDVVIERFADFGFRARGGTSVRVDNALVELADGRSLTRSARVQLRRGPARLLVLRGFGRVIDVATH